MLNIPGLLQTATPAQGLPSSKIGENARASAKIDSFAALIDAMIPAAAQGGGGTVDLGPGGKAEPANGNILPVAAIPSAPVAEETQDGVRAEPDISLLTQLGGETLAAPVALPAPASAQVASPCPEPTPAQVRETGVLREISLPLARPEAAEHSAPASPSSETMPKNELTESNQSTAKPPAAPAPRLALHLRAEGGNGPVAPVEQAAVAPANHTAQTQAAPAPMPATPTAEAPLAAPVQTIPAPANLTETAAPATRQPHDFEALIDRLAQARESAQTGNVRVSVAHSEFGAVNLRFEQSAGTLAIAMSSADPEFANIARHALADRAPFTTEAARTEAAPAKPEQSSSSQWQSAQNGQSQAQTQGHNPQGQNPSRQGEPLLSPKPHFGDGSAHDPLGENLLTETDHQRRGLYI